MPRPAFTALAVILTASTASFLAAPLAIGANGGALLTGDPVATTTADPSKPTTDGVVAVRLSDGRAAAPRSAPPEVQQAIWAANKIVGKPYRYGGGHARFNDTGYDCSGTISYALKGAKALTRPLDSTSFMSWGEDGPGEWITVYAHRTHAYVVIAGLRLDTSAAGDPKGQDGPRWRPMLRSSKGFTVRHPEAL